MGYARLLFATLLLMLVAAVAPASAATIPQQLNVNLSIDCPRALPNCSANTGDLGSGMIGSADFSSVAPGWTFNFMSGPAISFCEPCTDGNLYEADFGQGGMFTMTGPAGLGLTFTGVVTSGSSNFTGFDPFFRSEVLANFFGQWSNGQSASGMAHAVTFDLGPGVAYLSTSVVPEPGSLVLLNGGIVALAARVAPSLKRKLKS